MFETCHAYHDGGTVMISLRDEIMKPRHASAKINECIIMYLRIKISNNAFSIKLQSNFPDMIYNIIQSVEC
jgi:hypothetical protein